MAVALAAGDLKIDAPEPSAVGVQEDAPDAALAVEDVIVLVLP
jgi:hypothetical protein